MKRIFSIAICIVLAGGAFAAAPVETDAPAGRLKDAKPLAFPKSPAISPAVETPPAPEPAKTDGPMLDGARKSLIDDLLGGLRPIKLPDTETPALDPTAPPVVADPPDLAKDHASVVDDVTPPPTAPEPDTEAREPRRGPDDPYVKARKLTEDLERMLAILRRQRTGEQADDENDPNKAKPIKTPAGIIPDIAPPEQPAGTNAEIGLLLMDLDRFEEALPYIDKSLDKVEQAAMRDTGKKECLLLGRAICLRRLGKDDDAQFAYQELRDTFPDSPMAAQANWMIKSIQWLKRYNKTDATKTTSTPVTTDGSAGTVAKEKQT